MEGKRAEGSTQWTGQNQIRVDIVVNDLQNREGEVLELTEQEMVHMARVLAGVMTAAEDYYSNLISFEGN